MPYVRAARIRSPLMLRWAVVHAAANGLAGVLLFVHVGINHAGRVCVGSFPHCRPEYIHRIVLNINSAGPAGIIDSIHLRALVGILLYFRCARPGNVPVAIAGVSIINKSGVTYNNYRS